MRHNWHRINGWKNLSVYNGFRARYTEVSPTDFLDKHQFGDIDFKRLHPQSLGHDRGERMEGEKNKIWQSVWRF